MRDLRRRRVRKERDARTRSWHVSSFDVELLGHVRLLADQVADALDLLGRRQPERDEAEALADVVRDPDIRRAGRRKAVPELREGRLRVAEVPEVEPDDLGHALSLPAGGARPLPAPPAGAPAAGGPGGRP